MTAAIYTKARKDLLSLPYLVAAQRNHLREHFLKLAGRVF